MYCVCLYDMSWGKSDCAAPLFICTHQVTLVALQEFLSNMESHRQRGYKVLEKMRANHLQVWWKFLTWIRCSVFYYKFKSGSNAVYLCGSSPPTILLRFAGTCLWVGAFELHVAETGGRAAEGKSRFRTWPRSAVEPRLGARRCWRTQSNEITYSQKDSETVQTGITLLCETHLMFRL